LIAADAVFVSAEWNSVFASDERHLRIDQLADRAAIVSRE
jgi:hypothetical protein